MINRAGNKEKAKRVLNENGNLSGMVGIFPRFWKCVIMDDKSRIYPEERGHLYVHKTIAAGTAERFTGSR